MAVRSGDFTAAFFVTFIATVFVPDSAVAPQLSPPQNAYRGPSMLISKKIFRHLGTSREQMTLTTKYPNFCFLYFTIFTFLLRTQFWQNRCQKVFSAIWNLFGKKNLLRPKIKISRSNSTSTPILLAVRECS